jgi:N4-gp56 family major capsid protein
MGLIETVYAGTYGTKTTTVGAGVPSVFWSKEFLDIYTNKLQLARFAVPKPLPEGNGLTIEFTRPRPLSPATTALTQMVTPDATMVYFQMVQATLAEYGAWGQVGSLVSKAHLNQNLLGAVETFANQAADTSELLAQMIMCSYGSYPMRADLDETKEFTGTLGTVTSTSILAGGAALEAHTNYGDTDNDLNQSIITMLSGPAMGESRTITDFDADGGATGTAASGKMTLTTAFDMTPVTGDSYRVCSPDALASGDDLSFANMKAARTLLIKKLATKFPNGRFVAILSPDQIKNLQDDTDWKAVHEYKDRTRGIEDGAVGDFAGFTIYESTLPFGFPIETIAATGGATFGPGAKGANYTASGPIETALLFGQKCFGVTTFKKEGGSAMRPPVTVKLPNKFDKSDPQDQWASVAWRIPIVYKPLWSLHSVGLWTYMT